MNKLSCLSGNLYEAAVGDKFWIGNIPYFARKFARGGMGYVLFLRRDDFHRPSNPGFSVHGPNVAIKTLIETDDSDTSMSSFHRELTIWAGLRHPNIITLNELLKAPDDLWVAAMDWCPGSLEDYAQAKKTVPADAALFIVYDIISGLEHAQRTQGILHLDVKPANVLFKHDLARGTKFRDDDVRRYRWAVSDWGIASVKNSALARHTQLIGSLGNDRTMNNVGTEAYMAPERFILGHRSTVKCDVFSLGMMLLRLVSGDLPFRENAREQLTSGAYFANAKEQLRAAHLHKAVTELIIDMICPDPDGRPSSYELLQERFRYAATRTQSFWHSLIN